MGRNRNTKKYNTIEELVQSKSHWEGDCRIWEAGVHNQGYPMCSWRGSMHLVARLQLQENGEELPRMRRVKNKCGNKLCVNTDHYYIAEPGTEEWKCKGFKYPEEKRRAIYEEWKATKHEWGSNRRIQRKHDISASTFYNILKEYT